MYIRFYFLSLQDMLVFLFQEGPFTRGIFRRSAGAKACRELRDKLDSGIQDVPMSRQSIFVIAAVLKVSVVTCFETSLNAICYQITRTDLLYFASRLLFILSWLIISDFCVCNVCLLLELL